MKIFVESIKYDLSLLRKIFGEKFYAVKGDYGIINQVGYFHSIDKEVIYLLPKIFLNETQSLLFNKYDIQSLAENSIENSLLAASDFEELSKFLIVFYKGLIEYRNRYRYSSLLEKENTLQLNSTIGANEFSYLDIVLSLMNFHRKNKSEILFTHKKQQSKQHRRVNWTKTIRKNTPIFLDGNVPVYTQISSRKKIVDNEEQLFIMFYSVLHYLKSEFRFNIKIDRAFKIVKGKAFENLTIKAPTILKKSRYKYFNDTSVKMHRLLQLYFSNNQTGRNQKNREEFITVRQYNLVFEDMIDKLFSDNLDDLKTDKGISLKRMKEQKDGKIVDHLFEYASILDRNENIYYIGDSKYYKPGNTIGGHSIYKQFTYAKNVIQFNIDLLNENKTSKTNTVYRDNLTEGYNITPNFFIQGRIFDNFNYSKHCLNIDLAKGRNGIEHSFHFPHRLFDRDTLFVHHYSINFLFVLDSYSNRNSSKINSFRKEIKKSFRENFVDYIRNKSDFKLYYIVFKTENLLEEYVSDNFRKLSGKIYRTKDYPCRLILAKHDNDIINIANFSKFEFDS